MSLDVAAIVERARIAAAQGRATGQPAPEDREKLKKIAAEFESMLLVQMLKDMRKAGSWGNEEESENDTFGAASLFETIDVELAGFLARERGVGLQQQMLEAFDRLQPGTGAAAPPAAATVVAPSAAAPVAPTTESAEVAGTVEAPAAGPQAFLKPVDGAVTSDFGWRRDPFTQRAKFHQGVDLRAAYGQEVQAAGAGRVVFSGEQGGYGTSVVIEHQDGTRTRYAHLSAALVGPGDRVGAGEAVGRAGRSGRATGTHLHFEVIGRDGRRLPPQQWAKAGIQMTGESGD